jgi:hypothetical protein
MNLASPKYDRLAQRTRQFTHLCAFLKQQQNRLREGRRNRQQEATSFTCPADEAFLRHRSSTPAADRP